MDKTKSVEERTMNLTVNLVENKFNCDVSFHNDIPKIEVHLGTRPHRVDIEKISEYAKSANFDYQFNSPGSTIIVEMVPMEHSIRNQR